MTPANSQEVRPAHGDCRGRHRGAPWALSTPQVTIHMASKTVTINLDNSTQSALFSGGYSLFGWMAVQGQGPQPAGFPVIWFQLPYTILTPSINVTWLDQYKAYISTTVPVVPGVQVNVGVKQAISPGQTADIGPGGAITVVSQGQTGVISINNQTSTEYTCGIAQPPNGGTDAPLCALPLYGQQLNTITPVDQVLLAFSTRQGQPGVAVEYFYDGAKKSAIVYGQGLLIDLTAVDQCTVQFKINQGWTWSGCQAQEISVSADLVPVLLQP
jgi:hypothetical protein